MKFVFWQNIISIHQSAFLNALSERHEVVLVAAKDMEDERKGQGWVIPGLDKIKIVISPSDLQIINLIDSTAIHVFSGISAYPIVFKAFKYAIDKRIRIGVMLEPYDWRGLKGLLRQLNYYYLRVAYKRKIDFILTTGIKGIEQYQSIGFNADAIYQWGYFVQQSKFEFMPVLDNEKSNLLFVGRIDENKNVLLLIDTLKKYTKFINKFTIIGDGPLKSLLLDSIKEEPQFDYIGTLSNELVVQQMLNHDLLILPSKYDGWGAVVNEALHCGMRVIASANCGSSVLLDGVVRGEQFDLKSSTNFDEVLTKWINKGTIVPPDRQKIADWSNNHISGKAAATYFESIIEYVYSTNQSKKPLAPWL